MRATRRGFLLGSASTLGLSAFGWRGSALSAPTIHDPALEAITAAVRSIAGLLHPYPLGVDLCDVRAVTRPGCGLDGLAGYGEGRASGPDRARMAAARAMQDLRSRYA